MSEKCIIDNSRPCGSKTRAKNRYTRSEIDELAKKCFIDHYKTKTIDVLCKEITNVSKKQGLYKSPKVNKSLLKATVNKSMFFPNINKCMLDSTRPCGSKVKSSNRYTRNELDKLAKECNVPKYKTKNMDMLCKEMSPKSLKLKSKSLKSKSLKSKSLKPKSKSLTSKSLKLKSLKSIEKKLNLPYRHELCKLNTKSDKPVVTLYYFKYTRNAKKGTLIQINDIGGIFTQKSDAEYICKCLNTNYNKSNISTEWNLAKPYKIQEYTIHSLIENLPEYKEKENNLGDKIYIVYAILISKRPKSSSYKIEHLVRIGNNSEYAYPTKLIKRLNNIKLVTFDPTIYTVDYKLNTVFATPNIEDYQINKKYQHVPKSLYSGQLYTYDAKIPLLDQHGIKYTLWDNADNIHGACVWYAISKALNMPMQEMGKKIKVMSTQVSPNIFYPQDTNVTNDKVYNKLINYENETIPLAPKYLCYVPKFAKDYAVITFQVFKGSETSTIFEMSGIQCFFPKNPTKVIFTCSIKFGYKKFGHHLLVKLENHKGWAYDVNDVQDVLNILPESCKKS